MKQAVLADYFRRGRLSTAMGGAGSGDEFIVPNGDGSSAHIEDPFIAARRQRVEALERQIEEDRRARRAAAAARGLSSRNAASSSTGSSGVGEQPVRLFGVMPLPDPRRLRRRLEATASASAPAPLAVAGSALDSDEPLAVVTSYDPEGDGSWDDDLSEQVEAVVAGLMEASAAAAGAGSRGRRGSAQPH